MERILSAKHTSPTRILSYTATIPMRGALIASFEEIASPLFQQINCLIETNQKLRAARDLLLPRLMSGEIGCDEVLMVFFLNAVPGHSREMEGGARVVSGPHGISHRWLVKPSA